MKKKYKELLQILGYAILVYLAYSFLVHGISALKQNPSFIGLLTELGIPFPLASGLIIVVGILDLLVVIALFTFRNKWTLLYAGFWPLVPAIIGFITSNYFNLGYVKYPMLAGVAYWIFIELQDKESFFSTKDGVGEKIGICNEKT